MKFFPICTGFSISAKSAESNPLILRRPRLFAAFRRLNAPVKRVFTVFGCMNTPDTRLFITFRRINATNQRMFAVFRRMNTPDTHIFAAFKHVNAAYKRVFALFRCLNAADTRLFAAYRCLYAANEYSEPHYVRPKRDNGHPESLRERL